MCADHNDPTSMRKYGSKCGAGHMRISTAIGTVGLSGSRRTARRNKKSSCRAQTDKVLLLMIRLLAREGGAEYDDADYVEIVGQDAAEVGGRVCAAMTYAGSFHAEVEELGDVEEISDDMKVQHEWLHDVRIKGAFKYLLLGADVRDAMKEAFTRKCLECVSAILWVDVNKMQEQDRDRKHRWQEKHMGGQLLQRITDADKLSSMVWCRRCVGYVTSNRLGKRLANVCCSM